MAHQPDSCDILSVALHNHPLRDKSPGVVFVAGVYLLIFGLYWAWTTAHFVTDLRDTFDIKHFVNNKLGISERQVCAQ